VIVLFATGSVPAAAANAGDEEGLRHDLVEFAETLAQGAASESALAVRDQVVTADAETMRALADAVARQPGWPAAREVMRSVGSLTAERGRSAITAPGAQTKECVDVKLPLTTKATMGLIVLRGVLELAAEGLHVPCDVVSGPANAGVCIAAAIADGLVTLAQVTLDESDTCDGELDSLAHDAAIQTQNGMATQLDLIEVKVDANSGAAQRTAQRQLEKQLRNCEPLVSLVLPKEFGGGLEEVRDLVARLLQQAQLAAVGDIPEATKQLQLGNRALEISAYRPAYRNYCLAYRALGSR
jgi:hypothetical protein